MLNIKNLTKLYPGTTKGVRDINLHVASGDLYAFIGHNGAGKSTTLKAVCGIHPFDSGSITIDGIDLVKTPIEAKRRMAYLPDQPDLFDYLTGMQFLDFVCDVCAISFSVRKAKIEEYTIGFGIETALSAPISSYSHGMKQKLALTSAFIRSPRLLVLDEPFVGLDPLATVAVKTYMKELCENGGAVFFSTHVLDVAERLCNKVAIIKSGSLVFSGAMDEVLARGETLESLFIEVATHE